MENKEVTEIVKELQADIERLKYLNDIMDDWRKIRLMAKYRVRGSYREVESDTILENLGRNTVQFAMVAAQMGKLHPSLESKLEKKLLDQGGDIINLVLMVIDKKAGI